MSNLEPHRGPAVGRGSVAALLLAAVLGAATVCLAYGISLEYGDTGAPPLEVAWDTVRTWFFGIALAGAAALAAVLGGVRSRQPSRTVEGIALAVLVGTVVSVAVAGVLGVEAKFRGYPAAPRCTDEVDGGPATRVTRAAQRGFEGIDHPAPFSGGGSSGVDGCSSELMVRHDVDPVPAYRTALDAAGWRIATERAGLMRAENAGLAFELTREGTGTWTVWIGPEDRERRVLEEGQVGPRS